MKLPTISIIIPTLNAQKALKTCLNSVKRQDYPKSKIKLIIADGGSTDHTINVAQSFNAKIVHNPLKTGEAGKAVAIKHVTTKYLCLLDSDNILPDKFWLKFQIQILQSNLKLIGVEPIAFTYRRQAGFIERYSALIGANDPYAFVTGVYDKKNYINYRWTDLNIKQFDKGDYIQVILDPKLTLPTIGANSTIYKSSFLKKNLTSDYLFDIDILQSSSKPIYFAKSKTTITHTFCESSVSKFIKKQQRRLTDYYHYQKLRRYSWQKVKPTKFILYSISLILPLKDSLIGFSHQPDPAWLFHPLACLITLFIYSIVTIKFRLGLLKPLNRRQWKQ